MYGVYKNANCNISASGFPDGVNGFLLNQRQIDPTPVNVHPSYQFLETESSTAQNGTKATHHLMRDYSWRELRESPIFTRAWTLQEQLLVSAPGDVQYCPYSD